MKNILINYILKYIQFVPFYLVGSGAAFTIDLIVFTLLRNNFGANISAIIAFLFGTFTSFIVLSSILKYRLKRKRVGILIQLLIGVGTLIINIIVLNMIDLSSQRINYELYINDLNKSYYYAFISKTIASCVGFLWTSSLTGKFLFKNK